MPRAIFHERSKHKREIVIVLPEKFEFLPCLDHLLSRLTTRLTDDGFIVRIVPAQKINAIKTSGVILLTENEERIRKIKTGGSPFVRLSMRTRGENTVYADGMGTWLAFFAKIRLKGIGDIFFINPPNASCRFEKEMRKCCDELDTPYFDKPLRIHQVEAAAEELRDALFLNDLLLDAHTSGKAVFVSANTESEGMIKQGIRDSANREKLFSATFQPIREMGSGDFRIIFPIREITENILHILYAQMETKRNSSGVQIPLRIA